ncbi:MAG TPA: single-stranded-DNA-specific exonuclease RecJ [Alphaproteobacteria bacterium]|nr:single-stranded-DNA-specific exonuclease RecJ [Alphaproteobacteria bacterium]
MASSAAFLGVERSLLGRRWRQRAADDRAALALAQRLAVPEPVARVLAGRGIALDGAESFLNPTLRASLPDPFHLRDMNVAATRIADAVMSAEPIGVFGDYDVDGATSAALLQRFFAALGVPVRLYIPDRLREGYGPNAPALLRLRAEGLRLVVTVDCGTAAHDPLAAAAAAGLDVIVVDHHVAEPKLPVATAVVNPNRLDEESPHRQLAAVGVAFLLVVAVNRVLREAGWYRMRCEPDLMQWLDLVALGTVCDVVPLTGVNRALVRQGLKILARRANPGLAALADIARIDEAPGAFHLGFLLGPRVNAGGRVGEADLGVRLLTTTDPAEARALAARLDIYNQERQAIEAAMLEEAVAKVEAMPAGSIVFAAAEGWHPGVIGIIASRLKERYSRPSFVIALEGAIGKGSGRSVSGIDMGAAVIAAKQAGLITNGGGHAMAAGLTLASARISALREFLEDRIGAEISEKRVVPTLALDGALSLMAARRDLVALLEQLQPFGSGNAEPVFAVRDARVVRADVVGSGHVRCILSDPGGGRLKGIAFRCAETPLGKALLRMPALPLHIAGHLRVDAWAGPDGVQLVIEDAAEISPL